MTVTVMAAMLPAEEERHREKMKEGHSLPISLHRSQSWNKTQHLNSVTNTLLRLREIGSVANITETFWLAWSSGNSLQEYLLF